MVGFQAVSPGFDIVVLNQPAGINVIQRFPGQLVFLRRCAIIEQQLQQMLFFLSAEESDSSFNLCNCHGHALLDRIVTPLGNARV